MHQNQQYDNYEAPKMIFTTLLLLVAASLPAASQHLYGSAAVGWVLSTLLILVAAGGAVWYHLHKRKGGRF